MVDMANAIDFRLGHCNGEFHALRSKNEKSKTWAFHVGFILVHMETIQFKWFSGTCTWQVRRKIPGQVQNYQTFQLSLVSVKSLKQVKHTGTTLGIL